MNKHEKILNSYRRNHNDDDIEEVEKSKITNEKYQIKNLEQKAKKFINKALVNYDDTCLDEAEVILNKSKKVTGNLNSHKTRLIELHKNKEFN